MYTGLITTLYTLNFIKLYVNYSPIRASLVLQTEKNLPAVWETWIEFLGREDPLEENMAVFLPGESHGQSTLADYIPIKLKKIRHGQYTYILIVK